MINSSAPQAQISLGELSGHTLPSTGHSLEHQQHLAKHEHKTIHAPTALHPTPFIAPGLDPASQCTSEALRQRVKQGSSSSIPSADGTDPVSDYWKEQAALHKAESGKWKNVA